MKKRITNAEAKALLSNKKLIVTKCDDVDSLPDANDTVYYNAGSFGWNYSIVWSYALDCYVMNCYRVANTVLRAASDVVNVRRLSEI
ncbi:MAG: hypothetical protein ACI4YB_02110 [Oscillospiraceae bacterium]